MVCRQAAQQHRGRTSQLVLLYMPAPWLAMPARRGVACCRCYTCWRVAAGSRLRLDLRVQTPSTAAAAGAATAAARLLASLPQRCRVRQRAAVQQVQIFLHDSHSSAVINHI